jgi:hypothetical protein
MYNARKAYKGNEGKAQCIHSQPQYKMKMSNQLHAATTSSPRMKPLYLNWIRDCVGPRISMDMMVKRKIEVICAISMLTLNKVISINPVDGNKKFPKHEFVMPII